MLAFTPLFAHKGGVATRQRPTPDQHHLGVVLMPKAIRPIRIEGNLAYVPLTRGYEAIIDAADIALVERYRWCANPKPRAVYAEASVWEDKVCKRVSLHRTIMGEPQGLEVDHIDGDGLNNRRANLRAVTKAENARNAKIRVDNSSGYKGVTWHKQRQMWRARIDVDGTQRSLGMFETAEAAHAAYCAASAKLHCLHGRTA